MNTLNEEDFTDIIEWIKKWRENHGINGNEELSLNQAIEFTKELYGKIDELGYYDLPSNAEIVPYSTDFKNTYSWKIADGLSNNSTNLFYISDTKAGRLLNSDIFLDNVRLTLGSEKLADSLTGSSAKYAFENSGIKILSLNDEVSKNVMERYACRDVFTITPNASDYNVWMRTELPIIINKSSVKSINGIPRCVLKQIYDDNIQLGEEFALKRVSGIISEMSRYQMSQLKIYDISKIGDLETIFGEKYANIAAKGKMIVDTRVFEYSESPKLPDYIFDENSITENLLSYDVILKNEMLSVDDFKDYYDTLHFANESLKGKFAV
ncbi:MAG: hypothetical protein IJ167_11425, partial [Lachnospiraceae bacterium]|nr:hypothetical protein [Lachnospiraceae bacterium]